YLLSRQIASGLFAPRPSRSAGLGAGRAGAGNLRIQAGKRRVVENPRRGVADFLHREPYAAGLFVRTFVASSIRGLADAGRQGKGAFQDPDHLPDRDFRRFAAEDVTAPLPFFAVQQAGPFQLEKDGLKKFLWAPL